MFLSHCLFTSSSNYQLYSIVLSINFLSWSISSILSLYLPSTFIFLSLIVCAVCISTYYTDCTSLLFLTLYLLGLFVYLLLLVVCLCVCVCTFCSTLLVSLSIITFYLNYLTFFPFLLDKILIFLPFYLFRSCSSYLISLSTNLCSCSQSALLCHPLHFRHLYILSTSRDSGEDAPIYKRSPSIESELLEGRPVLLTAGSYFLQSLLINSHPVPFFIILHVTNST